MAHKKNKGTETTKAYKCRAQRFRKLPSSEDMEYFKTAAGYDEIKKALDTPTNIDSLYFCVK